MRERGREAPFVALDDGDVARERRLDLSIPLRDEPTKGIVCATVFVRSGSTVRNDRPEQDYVVVLHGTDERAAVVAREERIAATLDTARRPP
jgi:hypothetical protein